MATMKFSLSGFPEWLPEQRAIELAFLDAVRQGFELHGFVNIETRAVEPLERLAQSGDAGKEIYVLRRIHDERVDAGIGLHFDLTVPFARYVVENAGKLEFPFRRYQVQKVWRGERPQEGRYREFTQADIDVVGRDELPLFVDAEVAIAMLDVLTRLPIPGVTLRVNNRKLIQGFFAGQGVLEIEPVLRAVDKLAKLGEATVRGELADLGLSEQVIDRALALARIATADNSFADAVRALGVSDPLLDEGIAELHAVLDAIRAASSSTVLADLSIARGLDYYTGTVFETTLTGFEAAGSICSGGRYDSLAKSGSTMFPGVGISLGVSRLLGVLFGADALSITRPAATLVLVAVEDEATRSASNAVATALRARGIPTEVSPSAAKFGKQIKYADRRGIPYVWFVESDEVKDIRSGEQVPAATWNPSPDELTPRIMLKEPS